MSRREWIRHGIIGALGLALAADPAVGQLPHEPPIRSYLKEEAVLRLTGSNDPLSLQHTLDCGQAIGHALLENEGKKLVAAYRVVSKWGLHAKHMLPNIPLVQPDQPPDEYKIGAMSAMFVDGYRVTMGDQSPAIRNALQRRKSINPEAIRREEDGAILLYLATLKGMSQEMERDRQYGSREIATFCALLRQRWRQQARSDGRLPDLGQWGTRAALFLDVTGGKKASIDFEDFRRDQVAYLRELLYGGFRGDVTRPDDEKDHEKVDGLLHQHQDRLPEDICDRHRVFDPKTRAEWMQRMRKDPTLWLHRQRMEADRAAFARAFRETALPRASDFSSDWEYRQALGKRVQEVPEYLRLFGFSEVEIAGAELPAKP